MTRQEEWQSWCERFDETHHGVIVLFHDRAVWRTTRAMIDTNPVIRQTGTVENWLARCYTTTQLVGIRRECDGDKTSIGIRRALTHLAGCPRIATRAWYAEELARRDPDRTPEELDRLVAGFDQFAGPGKAFVDPALVKLDLERLSTAVEKAETYTNKVLAHRDDVTSGTMAATHLTWGDLDSAINMIGEIHKKYYTLRHPATMLGTLTPLAPLGWDTMFETPWKPVGFVPP